jgi:hypothetical protein
MHPHDDDDMATFLVNLYFVRLRKTVCDREAWLRAMQMVNQPSIYQMNYFHPDGREEQYEV